MKKQFLFGAITFLFGLLASCKTDKEKLVGIWQNESDWFWIKQGGKYNTGTGPTTFFTDLQMVVDEQNKEITFYTNVASKSYITQYNFITADTLVLQNKMEGSVANKFHKVAAIPLKF